MFELDEAFRQEMRNAVQTYWRVHRETGGRTESGLHIARFADVTRHVVNRVARFHFNVAHSGKGIELPGYYRRTKRWDVLITHRRKPVAAIEFKSMSASYGNNFNNRLEEAVGSSADLRQARLHGELGEIDPPFLGWLILVRDEPESSTLTSEPSKLFAARVFDRTSYIQRFQILCRRMVEQGLYDAATVIKSRKEDGEETGAWEDVEDIIHERDLSDRHVDTSLGRFYRALWDHLNRYAERRG